MIERNRIGCLQFACKPMDPESNISEVDRILSASGLLPELVVLPELFDVGYDLGALAPAINDVRMSVEALGRLAKKHGIALCGGLLDREGGESYNASFFFDKNGDLIGHYRKMCLFPLSHEDRLFSPGLKPAFVEWNGLKIGLAICFDLRFPELFRYYQTAGCHAVILTAAFPFPRLDHWRILLQARAVENQYWMIACNRAGADAGLAFLGDSQIIDPWGTVCARAGMVHGEMLNATILADSVSTVRDTIPCAAGLRHLKTTLAAKGE